MVAESLIARLRRMVNEPEETNYSDEELTEIIERYPLMDFAGNEPTASSWLATYDMNAAAAEVWEQKAGTLAGDFDFSADGGSYQRSQAYQQALRQSKHFRSRRAVRTVPAFVEPRPMPWEEDEDDE